VNTVGSQGRQADPARDDPDETEKYEDAMITCYRRRGEARSGGAPSHLDLLIFRASAFPILSSCRHISSKGVKIHVGA